MSFIFLRNRVTGGAAFTPASLFASGEEGAWYEPSTTTAFLSTTDLTPCGYGDACGFLLDKSQGAGYSGGSFTGLGSELVTNGTFDTDVSGFLSEASTSISWSGGVLEAISTSAGSSYVYQNITTEVGKSYLLECDFNDGGNILAAFNGVNLSGSVLAANTSANSSKSLIFVAQSTSSSVGARPTSAKTWTMDNISVRELPGNHATQGTEPARPILARVPEGGRRNELSETDTLATQSVTVTAAQRTLSFTGTGTVTLTGASTAGPLVGTGAGDRVSLTFTPSAGSLTLTVLGTVTDAQLELGASATTYQSVADSLGYDITEAGVTSLEYLAFDGSDDLLASTSSTLLSALNGSDITLFAASDEEMSVNVINTSAGDQYVEIQQTVPNGNRAIYRNTSFQASALSYATPSVIAGSFNATAKTALVRSNGVDGTVSAATTSTLTSASQLTIGALDRNTTDIFYAGKLFGALAIDRALTTQEISDTESYLAAKSGVTL